LVIPNSVRNIGEAAFWECSQLGELVIGSGVTNIETRAFQFCGSLKALYCTGNAPAIGDYAFDGSFEVTVYYLPGTTGWSGTYAGRPAALWLPSVNTEPTTFGIHSNQFGFTINWANGMTTIIEACNSLSDPDWFPVSTNIVSMHGTAQFSDFSWTNHPARFYRVRWP
jgi:hypothetical protein